jgi:hypothetical protein
MRLTIALRLLPTLRAGFPRRGSSSPIVRCLDGERLLRGRA